MNGKLLWGKLKMTCETVNDPLGGDYTLVRIDVPFRLTPTLYAKDIDTVVTNARVAIQNQLWWEDLYHSSHDTINVYSTYFTYTIKCTGSAANDYMEWYQKCKGILTLKNNL